MAELQIKLQSMSSVGFYGKHINSRYQVWYARIAKLIKQIIKLQAKTTPD